MAKSKKKLTVYKKILLTWVFALFLLCILAWVYVFLTMKDYEKNQPTTFIENTIKDIKKNPEKYFEIKSNYESKDYVKKILNKEKMSYDIKKDEAYLCIKLDKCKKENAFAIIKLNESDKVQKLKMLNYSNLKVDSVENATQTVKIYASTGSNIKINNIDIDNKSIIKSTEIEELKEGYQYTNLPKVDYYEVDGFTITPEVTSKDNNVSFKDGSYYVDNYATFKTFDEAKSKIKDNFNPITFAEIWSQFLTAEYDMEAGRGLNRVSPYLIEGTSVYNKAKAWATNVDITFTSIHTMDGFAKEEITNVTIYNENAFAADVYLEKNMTLPGGEKKTDVFNERINFIYYDGAYRVISMKAITH